MTVGACHPRFQQTGGIDSTWVAAGRDHGDGLGQFRQILRPARRVTAATWPPAGTGHPCSSTRWSAVLVQADLVDTPLARSTSALGRPPPQPPQQLNRPETEQERPRRFCSARPRTASREPAGQPGRVPLQRPNASSTDPSACHTALSARSASLRSGDRAPDRARARSQGIPLETDDYVIAGR